MFCAAIRKDSVSLLSFPFLAKSSHVRFCLFVVFKYLYNCFSSHLCLLVIVLPIIMLSVLFLVAIISLSLLLWMWSSILLLLLLMILLFTLLEFLTSALADGLSLEFEWQQVYSSLPDSSQYSGRSQQCWSLDGLHSSTDFQVIQSL